MQHIVNYIGREYFIWVLLWRVEPHAVSCQLVFCLIGSDSLCKCIQLCLIDAWSFAEHQYSHECKYIEYNYSPFCKYYMAEIVFWLKLSSDFTFSRYSLSPWNVNSLASPTPRFPFSHGVLQRLVFGLFLLHIIRHYNINFGSKPTFSTSCH